jgi:hypothetical protein
MVDAIGVVRLLGKQQPDKMKTYKLRPITETAEQAKQAKGGAPSSVHQCSINN